MLFRLDAVLAAVPPGALEAAVVAEALVLRPVEAEVAAPGRVALEPALLGRSEFHKIRKNALSDPPVFHTKHTPLGPEAAALQQRAARLPAAVAVSVLAVAEEPEAEWQSAQKAEARLPVLAAEAAQVAAALPLEAEVQACLSRQSQPRPSVCHLPKASCFPLRSSAASEG